MAEYFQIPEVGTKVRPGSYFNVDKNGDDDSFGAIDGVVVAVFKATFGPVDKVKPYGWVQGSNRSWCGSR